MSHLLARAAAAAAVAAALATAAPAAAQGGALPPAKQIVERYEAAVGGRAAWSRHQSRHVVMETTMTMGTIKMDIKSQRPDRMLVTMEMPGVGLLTSGYDGRTAWQNSAMTGPRVVQDAAELAQTQRQAEFDAGFDLARLYPVMETVGRGEAAGRPCYNVRMVTAQQDTVTSCFDVESGLIASSTVKQRSQMGEMVVTSLMSEYKDFGGVKLPTRTTASMMGQEIVTTIKSVDFEPIPASVFELPAEVKALVPAQRP